MVIFITASVLLQKVNGEKRKSKRFNEVFFFNVDRNKSRVPDQNGVSHACYIVEIDHCGPEPSKSTVKKVKDRQYKYASQKGSEK